MKEEIIQHILAGEEKLYKKENIQKYIDIIENKTFIKDSLDRAIATVFELVLERHINPWDIDLATFSNLYMEKVKNKKINLVVAGKILLLAWKILRMQSEEIIKNMETKEEVYMDEIPEWYGDDNAFIYTQKVIENEIPLKPKIRRISKRKVTLIELINAFEEAKEEISEKNKKKVTKKIITPASITETTHKENLEKEIKIVMEKISKLNGRAVPLKEIFDGKEIIPILLPILFLAKDGVIYVWQENFPYGEIYIKLNHGK